MSSSTYAQDECIKVSVRIRPPFEIIGLSPGGNIGPAAGNDPGSTSSTGGGGHAKRSSSSTSQQQQQHQNTNPGGTSTCLSHQDNTVKIKDPNSASKSHTFTYDCVFSNLPPSSSSSSSGGGGENSASVFSTKFQSEKQQQICDTVGSPMLRHCMGGYNTCVLAYGQTGSGKTYTMLGPPEKMEEQQQQQQTASVGGPVRGLIPRLAEAFFEEIAKAEQLQTSRSFRLEVSCFELYQETVQCLLEPTTSNRSGGDVYHVREDPVSGPFIEGLSKKAVSDEAAVMALVNRSAKLRHTGITGMNTSSSRSHAVFTFYLTRYSFDQSDCQVKEVVSKMHLVDLAGSERVGKSNTSGKRLMEGSVINKSLLTLGRVIEALAHAPSATGTATSTSMTSGASSFRRHSLSGAGVGVEAFPSRHIPYRDSLLTWLLKDALGGNSLTHMLATISPMVSCYEETLSTLKYADSVKCIRNHAVVTVCDSSVHTIAELKEEICRLRSELAQVEFQHPHVWRQQQQQQGGDATAAVSDGSGDGEVRDEGKSRQKEQNEKETENQEVLTSYSWHTDRWKIDGPFPYLIQISPLPQLHEPFFIPLQDDVIEITSSSSSSSVEAKDNNTSNENNKKENDGGETDAKHRQSQDEKAATHNTSSSKADTASSCARNSTTTTCSSACIRLKETLGILPKHCTIVLQPVETTSLPLHDVYITYPSDSVEVTTAEEQSSTANDKGSTSIQQSVSKSAPKRVVCINHHPILSCTPSSSSSSVFPIDRDQQSEQQQLVAVPYGSLLQFGEYFFILGHPFVDVTIPRDIFCRSGDEAEKVMSSSTQVKGMTSPDSHVDPNNNNNNNAMAASPAPPLPPSEGGRRGGTPSSWGALLSSPAAESGSGGPARRSSSPSQSRRRLRFLISSKDFITARYKNLACCSRAIPPDPPKDLQLWKDMTKEVALTYSEDTDTFSAFRWSCEKKRWDGPLADEESVQDAIQKLEKRRELSVIARNILGEELVNKLEKSPPRRLPSSSQVSHFSLSPYVLVNDVLPNGLPVITLYEWSPKQKKWCVEDSNRFPVEISARHFVLVQETAASREQRARDQTELLANVTSLQEALHGIEQYQQQIEIYKQTSKDLQEQLDDLQVKKQAEYDTELLRHEETVQALSRRLELTSSQLLEGEKQNYNLQFALHDFEMQLKSKSKTVRMLTEANDVLKKNMQAKIETHLDKIATLQQQCRALQDDCSQKERRIVELETVVADLENAADENENDARGKGHRSASQSQPGSGGAGGDNSKGESSPPPKPVSSSSPSQKATGRSSKSRSRAASSEALARNIEREFTRLLDEKDRNLNDLSVKYAHSRNREIELQGFTAELQNQIRSLEASLSEESEEKKRLLKENRILSMSMEHQQLLRLRDEEEKSSLVQKYNDQLREAHQKVEEVSIFTKDSEQSMNHQLKGYQARLASAEHTIKLVKSHNAQLTTRQKEDDRRIQAAEKECAKLKDKVSKLNSELSIQQVANRTLDGKRRELDGLVVALQAEVQHKNRKIEDLRYGGVGGGGGGGRASQRSSSAFHGGSGQQRSPSSKGRKSGSTRKT